MSNKYSQKPLDGAKKATADARKTAEKTGDLIGNKIPDKIKSPQNASKDENKIETPKERYITRKKTANNWWVKKSII